MNTHHYADCSLCLSGNICEDSDAHPNFVNRSKKPPVPGWLWELLLCVASAAATYLNHSVEASVFTTGAIVVGVVRMIEKDRRA